MGRREDQPSRSPDGRFVVEIDEYAEQYAGWTETFSVRDTQTDERIVRLSHLLDAQVEWGAAGCFTLFVTHSYSASLIARVEINADTRLFSIRDDVSGRGLAEMPGALEKWFAARLRLQAPPPAPPALDPPLLPPRLIANKWLDAVAALGVLVALAVAIYLAIIWA